MSKTLSAMYTAYLVVALFTMGGCNSKAAHLHRAIDGEDASQVEELIADGADPNSYYDDMHAVARAAMIGNRGILEALLKAKADPNGRTDVVSTGLMLAQDADIVTLLLEYGADVNAQNDMGRTALMYARSVTIGVILLDAGANIELTDVEGGTAEDYHQRRPMTRELVEIIRERRTAGQSGLAD